MHADIVPRRNMRSENRLFVFESKGFRTRLWQKVLGSAFSHASKIWQSYKKEGSKAIKLGRRGRRKGEKRTLSTEQESR